MEFVDDFRYERVDPDVFVSVLHVNLASTILCLFRYGFAAGSTRSSKSFRKCRSVSLGRFAHKDWLTDNPRHVAVLFRLKQVVFPGKPGIYWQMRERP